MHTCPVCGYDQLSEPPKDFTICPSCGTEFEYDDVRQTVEQLRAAWLQTGPRWWSTIDPLPVGWDPYKQMFEAFYLRKAKPAPTEMAVEVKTICVEPKNILGSQYFVLAGPIGANQSSSSPLEYMGGAIGQGNNSVVPPSRWELHGQLANLFRAIPPPLLATQDAQN
jgi:hypothetical protein